MAIPLIVMLPTKRSDGTDFLPSDIAWVILERDGVVVSSAAGPTTQFFDNPPSGTHTYAARIMDNQGNEVRYSVTPGDPIDMNEAIAELIKAAPVAPNG